MATEAIKKLDIVEIAMKKRRLKLYEKISRGDVLTRAELTELKKYEDGEGINPGIVESWKDIQRVFGVSEMTVSRWIKQGMPALKDGKFSIVEIQTWRNTREGKAKPETGKVQGNTSRKEAAEADYREYKAELARIEVATKNGELVKMSEVEAGLIQVSMAIKMALLRLPTILAPRLQGLEPRHIEKEVREQIETIIDSISKEKIFATREKKNASNSRKTKNMDSKRK